MKKNIAVIGLGIFGHEVAVGLAARGNTVVAVDVSVQAVERIKDSVAEAMVANIADEEAMADLGLDQFDLIIIGLGSNFEELVLGVTCLNNLGARRIIARASSLIQEQILLKIGADEVILPEKQSAAHLAERLTVPNLLDFLKLDQEIDIAEILVDEALAGKSFSELDLRRRHKVTVLILKRRDQSPQVVTDPDQTLLLGDRLVVIGRQVDIEKIFATP